MRREEGGADRQTGGVNSFLVQLNVERTGKMDKLMEGRKEERGRERGKDEFREGQGEK